jgi:RNA recognition motif-containing protein
LGAAPPQKFRADSPREKTPADDGKQGRDEDKKLTVKREGGGKQWEDTSLLEWDPSHFRLFVGNLSQEVTDEMLKAPFERYKSLSKVRVVKDHRTDKCKGFGFVAFVDPEDYFKAFKEVNGKYVGNHPIQLKRATTEIKPSAAKTQNRSNKSRHRR